MLGTDPATGRLAEGGIATETRQVCENLKAEREAAGSALDRVVKVTISPEPPARTTAQAGRAVRHLAVRHL